MFSRLSVSRKIQVLGLVPLALFLLLFFTYLLPVFGARFMDAKKEGARNVVDLGYHLLAGLESRVQKGELNLEQAQQLGRSGIMSMRYEDNNYLWLASPGARIADVAGRFRQVGAAARAQTETSREVSVLVDENHAQLTQNASATQELSATVVEITHTASDLAEVAEGLRSAVGGFKL